MTRIARIIFFLCLFAFNLRAQDRSAARIKSAYLYRFAESTTWPNEAALQSFNIGIYGNAPEMWDELVEIKKSNELKGLPIKLTNVKNIEEVSNIQLLYTPNQKCEVMGAVIDKAQAQNILWVSDQCDTKNSKMINFIHENNKIRFEINTLNIKSADLDINPKLLLLGGDELDVLEVFNQSEKSLEDERQKGEQLKNELSLLKLELQEQKSKYDLQLQQLNAQKKEMKMLSDSISYQQNRYSVLQRNIENQAETIHGQQSILDQKLLEIESQSHAYSKNKQLLEEQNLILDNQLQLINEHESKIEKQVSVIQLQKYGLIVSIFIISLILGFITLLIRNHKIKKHALALVQSKNKELVNRQQEISIQNEELKKQRKELLDMTEALSLKSEQLQISIQEVENVNEEISKINENLEETVRLRTEELREQHEKILNYLSHNSHIVRGPLSRILGLTNLFNSSKPDSVDEIMDDITNAAVEVDKVVNEINGVLQSERQKFD